jgi:Subtilase family
MSRSLQSRRRAERWIPLAFLVLGNLFPFPAGAAETGDCRPFEAPYAPVALAAADAPREGGVAASATGEPRAGGGGAIVSLPRGGGAPPTGPVGGEALLALPKQADGTLPRDFELGPGARIAGSFWSPVLCATVARIVGPPGASVPELVPRVPTGGTATPNDRYATAGIALRALPTDPPAGEPDPYRSLEYGLDRLGVESAWPVSEGSGVRIALLDSAPDASHRDLAGLRIEALPDGPAAAPATHGTLLAGVLHAQPRNGFGIAGVAPGAELVAVPVCTPVGATASDECRLYDLLRGVDRAWELEATVLNLSLVGPPNPLLERSMARLEKLGALVVAAAGNDGTSEPRYPAAYPSVVGVGAVGPDGALYARGNRGPSAEILAPGVEVLSTVPGDAFAFGDGTSLAAAHVSGALAILVGASGDPVGARTALFQAAEAARAGGAPSPPTVAPLCDALARLGKPCP